MRTLPTSLAIALSVSAGAATALGQLQLEMVRIGNPGNFGELSGETVPIAVVGLGTGQTRVCGGVDYVYDICKFEITAAQYVVFLNAVARNDPYGLYFAFSHAPGEPLTINIIRTGTAGSYTYSVPPDWANRPAGGIGWADAVRFANWMHNGQPTGTLSGVPALDAGLTEDGSYFINGAMTNPQLQGVTRKPTATWVVPSEDEWYKAAYHKNNGPAGSYWDYPMQSDAFAFGPQPCNDVLNPDPGNCANFWTSSLEILDDDTIGPPYFRTVVGEFENSASAYGTFDQGGNIWEWTDGRPSVAGTPGSKRILRGGSFYNLFDGVDKLNAAWRSSEFTAAQLSRYGLRLVLLNNNDCNGNGVADLTDLRTGTSADLNFNDIPDECDITRGTSRDCNSNGIPDEAEVGDVAAPPYSWDDGIAEESVGFAGGTLVWLNNYVVTSGRETIGAVALSYGFEEGINLNGAPVTIGLWSDPNGDGDPTDSVLLTSVPSAVAASLTNVITTVDIPDTHVGPVGTSFFVGAVISRPGTSFPARMDLSTSLSGNPARSWAVLDPDTENPFNPAALGAAPFIGTAPALGATGTWLVRAIAVNTTPQLPDADNDGIPDSCSICAADFNADGNLDPDDLGDYINCYFAVPPCPQADFNGDNNTDPDDLGDFINAYFAGCA